MKEDFDKAGGSGPNYRAAFDDEREELNVLMRGESESSR